MKDTGQETVVTSEEESAAKLLREKGWIVTKPANVKYGCFCELETCTHGTKPDSCLIDDKVPEMCTYAAGKTSPTECEY